jgi:hypothetical protein
MLRVVAEGAPEVSWSVDGQGLGTTPGHEALRVAVAPGPHSVVAAAVSPGPWRIVAHAEGGGPGLAYVPAWSAASPGDAVRPIGAMPAPGLLGLLAVTAFLARQSKRP